MTVIEAGLAALAAERPIVVCDDPGREDEGDIIFAAACATPLLLGWTIRHSSGVLCVPLEASWAEHLALPPMCPTNEDPKGTAYTVSCDAVSVRSTGISATDRAITARALADPAAAPAGFTRPGHMFPLRAVDGGVRRRPGHTEAAVDLLRAAKMAPVGVIAEVVGEDGEPLRGERLDAFARKHRCPLASIRELVEYLDRSEAGKVSEGRP